MRFVGGPSVSILRDSLDPTLLFRIQVELPQGEALIGATGAVFGADGKRVGVGQSLLSREQRTVQDIYATQFWDTARGNTLRNLGIDLLVPFSQRAIEHIESQRNEDPKRDVNLLLTAEVTYLNSRTQIRPTISEEIRNDTRNYMTLMPKEVRGWSSGRIHDWILSGDGSPVFLQVVSMQEKMNCRIPAADWLHDYAPHLNIGRFIVAELPILTPATGQARLNESINGATNAVLEMERQLRAGEWDEVIRKARPVYELVRRQEFRDFLASSTGFAGDTIDELWISLRSLTQFSSKFLHAIDLQGQVRQIDRASKEEAYLVFSISVGLINFIGRKVSKHGDSAPI